MPLFDKKPPKPNHQEFWDKTKFGKKHAEKMDTVDPYNPDHLDNFEKFLNSINTPNSTAINSTPSIIDSRGQVTKDQCVVSLILKYQHAFLVVESLSDNGIRMDWFDFIIRNKGKAHFASTAKLNRMSFGLLAAPQVALNHREAGMVRYCPTNNGTPLVDIPMDMTRGELFKKLNWDFDTESFTVPFDNLKKMLADIRADYDRTLAGKLKFKFCGHSSPRHNTAPDEVLSNCKTWVVMKLQSAGVDIRIDEDKCSNKIIAHSISIR